MPRTLSLVLLLLFAPRLVRAQVNCDDADVLPNPLYIMTGDTQQPLIKFIGKALRESTVHPMTLVYITGGSCVNIEAIRTGGRITTNAFYIPSTAQDPAWTPSMAAPTCVTPAGGLPLDVAISALSVSACDPAAPPSGIGEFLGPIQAYLFVVPEALTQVAITAREAYFVFGFGMAGMAMPWVDELFLFIRTITKSTLIAIAANIGVPPDKMKGVQRDSSTMVLNDVSTSTEPEKTIGLLGSEIYDSGTNRNVLNALAFKAFGQYFAYYPDSTATALDKKNIRDGHYTIWSPTVYMTHVDSGGLPTDPDAKYLIDLVTGKAVTPASDFNPLDIVIARGLVPDCAMHVARDYEGGDLRLYTPAEDCTCYYESKTGETTCASCSNSACASGVCRRDLCEVN